MTDLNPKVSVVQGLLVEGLATAILALIACAVWDSRNAHNTDSTAIRFGLGVTVLATSMGHYTGCSMNPARSLGPAFWGGYWSQHWIYWFGPIGGALLASLAYTAVFSSEPEDDDDTLPEHVALNSVDARKAEVSYETIS